MEIVKKTCETCIYKVECSVEKTHLIFKEISKDNYPHICEGFFETVCKYCKHYLEDKCL